MTKTVQPELPFTKPREIMTESSEEFFAMCDLAKAGDLVIEAIMRGEGNGQWIFKVIWRRP